MGQILAAFAIEDRVDFACVELEEDGGGDALIFPADQSIGLADNVYRASAELKGRHYFPAVRHAMETLLRDFHQKDPDKLVKISHITVSIPGVVREATTVTQLPLWQWPTFDGAFNFDIELKAIAESIGGHKLPEDRFVDVVNDATAFAAHGLYAMVRNQLKTPEHEPRRSVFVRAHSGINSSYIGDGVYLRLNHSESGHVFTRVYEQDWHNNFGGSCAFHGDCLEGMVCTRSFLHRALPKTGAHGCSPLRAGEPIVPIKKWADWCKDQEGLSDGELESKLFDWLFIKERDERAIQTAAFYLGHTVHHLLLYSPAPQHVVLGGRLATPEVVTQVIENVRVLLGGYPNRPLLTASLEDSIIRSEVAMESSPELSGALLIDFVYRTAPLRAGGKEGFGNANIITDLANKAG